MTRLVMLGIGLAAAFGGAIIGCIGAFAAPPLAAIWIDGGVTLLLVSAAASFFARVR
ncbi:hypothetical protein QF002_001479 [Paraburkholderia youngii]